MCLTKRQHGNGGWQPRSPGGRQPGWGSPGWPQSRRKFSDVEAVHRLVRGGPVAWYRWVFRSLDEHEESCRWRRLCAVVGLR